MRVKLLTKADETQLRKNGAIVDGDHIPVVKLFTPDGQATWLLSEISHENPDLAFGLCDLGMGSPELGYVSLSELRALRGKFGLPVERDRFARFDKPISHYAEQARAAGYIRL